MGGTWDISDLEWCLFPVSVLVILICPRKCKWISDVNNILLMFRLYYFSMSYTVQNILRPSPQTSSTEAGWPLASLPPCEHRLWSDLLIQKNRNPSWCCINIKTLNKHKNHKKNLYTKTSLHGASLETPLQHSLPVGSSVDSPAVELKFPSTSLRCQRASWALY